MTDERSLIDLGPATRETCGIGGTFEDMGIGEPRPGLADD
jgi:hypothetical protein